MADSNLASSHWAVSFNISLALKDTLGVIPDVWKSFILKLDYILKGIVSVIFFYSSDQYTARYK